MGWYGIFLVKKLKLAFSLRGIDENTLHTDFELFDEFFNKYDKLRQDIEYVQEISEEEKTFSAKTSAKMFNIVDELSGLPEFLDAFLLLYSLHKNGFEIKYYPENKINLGSLKKKGWIVIG